MLGPVKNVWVKKIVDLYISTTVLERNNINLFLTDLGTSNSLNSQQMMDLLRMHLKSIPLFGNGVYF